MSAPIELTHLSAALIVGACGSFAALLGSIVTIIGLGRSLKRTIKKRLDGMEMTFVSKSDCGNYHGETKRRFEDGSDKFGAIEGLLREIRNDQKNQATRMSGILTVLVLNVPLPDPERQRIMLMINHQVESG